MTKKSLGYVELNWTCPNCGSKNPGTATVCTSCGAPQPADVQFEQPAQETLISEAEKIKISPDSPDVHCAFCGTRNPASANTCSRCGADLSEGTAREKGKIVGAHRPNVAPDVVCPSCGSPNPANALRCGQCNANLNTTLPQQPAVPQPKAKSRSNTLIYAGIGLAIFACIALAFLFLRTEEIIGQVEGVQWTRTIGIEELEPVTYSDWRDEIPASASLGRCEERVRSTQNNPAPNSVEVCGTPYTIDTGTGLGEVVQDCVYEIYDDWCNFTVQEWRQVNEITARSADFSPNWPALQLQAGQREGARSEEFEIFFNTDGDKYTYITDDLGTFYQCEIGSEWLLEVNTFNAIVSITPAN